MSDAMRMYVEVGFNVLYLIVVWTMNGIMSARMRAVPQENRILANLFRWAFILLAVGDTGHVGFRVLAYALGGLEQNSTLLGAGALAAAGTPSRIRFCRLMPTKSPACNGRFCWGRSLTTWQQQ